MGYKHDGGDILAAAVAEAFDHGFGRLTFATVGKRLGVSDRTVVYYFATKAELIEATLGAMSAELLTVLEDAFGSDPLPADELMQRAWPVMSSAQAAPVMRVFFEVVGLSATGVSPYDSIVPALIDGWIDWVVPRVAAADDAARRAEAARIVAILDGLLLLQTQIGLDATAVAAKAIGLVDE